MRPKLLLAAAGPFVIMAGAAIVVLLYWDRIPERFPIHFGWNGEPDGWATRGPAVFLPLLIGLLVEITTLAIAFAALQQASASDAQSQRAQHVAVKVASERRTSRPCCSAISPSAPSGSEPVRRRISPG